MKKFVEPRAACPKGQITKITGRARESARLCRVAEYYVLGRKLTEADR